MWMTFLKETLRNYHRRMKEEPFPEQDFFDKLGISRKKRKKVFWFSPHCPETDLRLVSLTHEPFKSTWEIFREASLFPYARH